MCQEEVKKCSKCEFPLSYNDEKGWYCQACDPSGIDIQLVGTLQDLKDSGMLDDVLPDTPRTKAEIREKLDELLRRPTGLVDDLALVWRGRIEALRWVLEELDEL